MRRKTVHGGFAAVALCLTALSVNYGLELRESRTISRIISQIPAALTADDGESQSNQVLRYPEIRLAWANALSEDGRFDAAEAAFNRLIHESKSDAIARAAQFNLANAYLRQGMRDDIEASQRGPMLELAKQRYRDLLRVLPGDWAARYNLEIALRLAPEIAETLAEDKGKPIKSVRVIVPDFKAKDLP